MDFLKDVAAYYAESSGKKISFKLFDKGDEDILNSNYRIDPITVPLLLSLLEQLGKYHKEPLELLLYNNPATIEALFFLFRSDFFQIAGDNKYPRIPRGRNILEFNEDFLGSFNFRKIRNEHRVRAYSKYDEGVNKIFSNNSSEEKIRDLLMSFYTYKVREHYHDLLSDNQTTAEFHNLFVDILSELITNSVLYSQSTAFALMFVDKYKTKFSISDNGVGFSVSMSQKESTSYYKVNALKTRLYQKKFLNDLPSSILNNLYTIFETLFYSALKNRHGLFDLMIAVVLNGGGYFRIHSENSQIIISNRMMNELVSLNKIRNKIYNAHVELELNKTETEDWTRKMTSNAQEMMSQFELFCEKSFNKYNNDVRYSSIRFYQVKFRGVHIEVEIPNTITNDHIGNS